METDNRPEWGKKCSKACCLPQRVIVTIMGFGVLLCAYTNRVSLSHVITKLVIEKNVTAVIGKGVCPPEEVGAKQTGYDQEPIYEWSEKMQGLILGIFYIGYLITQLPGGVLADKYGAKWILFICMTISALSTALSSILIKYGHEWGLMSTRIIMGCAQGPIFPAITTLLSQWVPARERGLLGTLCYSGVTFGTIVSNLGSGLMLHNFYWPVTLYVFGFSTLLLCLIFAFIISDKPTSHPCIKPKELAYLSEEIKTKIKEKMPIPWKPMLLSKAMVALIFSQIGHDWGYYVMISCLPKYMADVLQFSIRSNGFVTSLPFAAMFVSTIISGALADWLIRTKRMSLDLERRLFTFLGAFLPGVFTVLASYAGCNKILVVTSFTLAMFSMGTYYAGQKLTPLDMSPTFSGTIMAICNGLGSFAGLGSPTVVGLMTPNATMNEWRGVFWLSFAILTITSIIFWIWGATEVQSYDPMVQDAQK